MEKPKEKGRIGLTTCTSLTIANMIGTGVFTSLGYQVGDLPSGFAIVALWAVGALLALCGALAYAELASALPRSGGEYHFLSVIYHPSIGFMAGLVSVVVGFSAPVALAGMAFAEYFHTLVPEAPRLGVSLVVTTAVTGVHLITVGSSKIFQNGFTFLKLGLIAFFIVAGFVAPHPEPVNFLPQRGDWGLVTSGAFAVSLMYVMYSYSGWNAATYVMGEARRPARDVPWSLIIAAAVVGMLYVLLNAVFLRNAPMAALAGKIDVGGVAAVHIFGVDGGRIMSGLICAGLISTISAMTWAGPRVMQTIGEDFATLRALAIRSEHGVPYVASLVQYGLVVITLLTSTFEAVLLYAQFALLVCILLTVVGVIVLRMRRPELPRPFRCWGYPATPLAFAAIAAFSMIHTAREKPASSLAGAGVVVAGLLIYSIGRALRARRRSATPT